MTITKSLTIGITSNSIDANAYLDSDEIEASLDSLLGHLFDELSKTNAALTAKIFGGTPKQDVDLMDFLSGLDPWYKQVKPTLDWEPIYYLYVPT